MTAGDKRGQEESSHTIGWKCELEDLRFWERIPHTSCSCCWHKGGMPRTHAKHALLIIVLKRACQHMMSVGIMLLAVLESHHSRLPVEAPGQGLNGGRVRVLKGVKISIVVEECINNQPDVPGMPCLTPLPVNTVEGTLIWGCFPE
jgi:hypothetical protein